MILLPYSRPWEQQPQEAADVSAAASDGLRSLLDVTRPQLVPQRVAASPLGVGLSFGDVRYWSTGITPNDAECSLLFIGSQGSQVNALLVSSCAASGDDGIELLCTGTAGQCSLRINTSGTALQTSTAATGLNDGKAHVYAAYWRSGEGARFYVDGALIATTSALSGTLNSTQPLYMGRRGTSYMSSGYGLLLAYWGKAAAMERLAPQMRSPQEAYGLLFEPQRIWVPVSAGGAVPTITALSARLITTTSAQPRISYS